MGSVLSVGVTEINPDIDRQTVTFSWTLINYNWDRYLSYDRSFWWNRFLVECRVQSPEFIGPNNNRFRLGLKENCNNDGGVFPLIAFAKFHRNVCGDFNWQVLTGDVVHGFRLVKVHVPNTKTKHGNKRLIVAFDDDPPDGTSLIIKLTLSIGTSEVQSTLNGCSCRESLSISSPRWLTDVSQLFASCLSGDELSELCDVTLITSGGQRFHANRSILACHSAVFAAMFRIRGRFIESKRHDILIEDVSPEDMACFLGYCYTGRLLRRDSSKSYRSLLIASDEYGLHGLKEECEKRLADQLTPENLCSMNDFANFYSAPLLQDACLRFQNNRSSLPNSESSSGLARQSYIYLKRLCNGCRSLF